MLWCYAPLLACLIPSVVLVGAWLVCACRPSREPWQGRGKGNALNGTPTCVCVRPSYKTLALSDISEKPLSRLVIVCRIVMGQGFVYIRVVPFQGGVVLIYKILSLFLLNTC